MIAQCQHCWCQPVDNEMKTTRRGEKKGAGGSLLQAGGSLDLLASAKACGCGAGLAPPRSPSFAWTFIIFILFDRVNVQYYLHWLSASTAASKYAMHTGQR